MKSDKDRLQEALDADPDHWEARRLLAEKLTGQSDHEAAAALIVDAPALPEDEEEFLAAARLTAPARPDHALLILDTLLELNPDNAAARELKAELDEAPGAENAAAPEPDVLPPPADLEAEEEPAPAIPVPLVHPSEAPPPDAVQPDMPPPDDIPAPDFAPAPEPDLAPAPEPDLAAPAAESSDKSSDEPTPATAPAITVAPPPLLQSAPAEEVLGEEEGYLTADLLHALEHEEERLVKQDARKATLSSLFVSMIVHVVILLLLGLVIIAVPRQAPPEIVAVAERAVPKDALLEVKQIRPTYTANTKPSAKVVQVVTSTNFSALAVPAIDEPPPEIAVPGLSMEEGLGMAISFSGDGDGWVATLPAAIQSRCSLVERMSRLKVGGGSKRCETAVERALTWLSENQNPDGSWGKSFPVAMTGLSLLSYLGRCETPDSPVFAETVVKAATYLMDIGLQNGGAMQSPGGKLAYEHGIATYALCELFTLSRRGKRQIPELRNIIEQAVPIIINGQNPNGSWLYKYAKGRSDTSVSGWQVQALKAAMNTQIEIPGLEESFEKSLDFLVSIQDPKNGGFGYSEDRREGRPSLSGVGVLGLQFGGREDSDEVKRGLEYILKSGRSMSYSNINFYGWYYSTQACFQEGDKTWRQWNDRFLKALLTSQESDGHWPPERSNQTDRQSDGDGDVYRTCLATLMLEVYYRYLPTGEKIKK